MRWLSAWSLSMKMNRILPLKPSAACLKPLSLLSWSAALRGRNSRMCVLISPPKIFGAVCSVNSMTSGSWLCLMKSSSFSLVTSPSKLFRPSSNWTRQGQPVPGPSPASAPQGQQVAPLPPRWSPASLARLWTWARRTDLTHPRLSNTPQETTRRSQRCERGCSAVAPEGAGGRPDPTPPRARRGHWTQPPLGLSVPFLPQGLSGRAAPPKPFPNHAHSPRPSTWGQARWGRGPSCPSTELQLSGKTGVHESVREARRCGPPTRELPGPANPLLTAHCPPCLLWTAEPLRAASLMARSSEGAAGPGAAPRDTPTPCPRPAAAAPSAGLAMC